mgnify:CR=1 FL=1
MTESQLAVLFDIRHHAKIRHEKARLSALKRGRTSFPMLPFECSWAFEEEWRRANFPSPTKDWQDKPMRQWNSAEKRFTY